MMEVKQEPFDQHFDEFKEEIIEFEESKIEERWNVLIKIDHDYVRECEYLQNFPINVSKEERNLYDAKETYLYEGISGVKQEACEFIQPKTESELLTLTTHIDLPTLKDECTDFPSYFNEADGKQSEIIFKPLTDTTRHGSKNRKRNYPCPGCSKNFPSSKSRSKHLEEHFRNGFVVCMFCGRLITKNEIFRHGFIHQVKNITRKKSPTINKEQLLGIDTNENPFNFGICLKKYSMEFYLKKHLITHINQKSFQCDICSKEFKRTWDLQSHLIIHTNKKPFKCNICSKEFKRKSGLRSHLTIHTNEKPFQCDICSKRFKRKFEIQLHLRTHSNENPFKCYICSKEFIRKCDLQSHHLTIHTNEKPFQCDICSKIFKRKFEIQLHLRTHSNEKPFKCYICSKEFNRNSYLNTHLLINSNEKSFKCDICFNESIRKSFNHILVDK